MLAQRVQALPGELQGRILSTIPAATAMTLCKPLHRPNIAVATSRLSASRRAAFIEALVRRNHAWSLEAIAAAGLIRQGCQSTVRLGGAPFSCYMRNIVSHARSLGAHASADVISRAMPRLHQYRSNRHQRRIEDT